MLQRTSNQRRPGCLIPTTPPLPSPRSSQPSSRSCLTTPQLPNQYYRATGSGVPSICLPACLPATICPPPLPPLPSSHSSSCFPLSRIHLRQGARARLLKAPDESATTTQLRRRRPDKKEGKVEGWRMQKVHLDWWVYCGLRGAPVLSIIDKR